ncbi:hypothetical protein LEP1GSC050_2971 [Leptospira broomii serovar Hurstbridge str. 5399]|uniref:Uncharacterized protein n=1 Tax=Leptospira broomii serovar Hurstbridge str. 5399 TaxID=1049789 RepID=T0GGL0_9LEPT|nr:hypothetical protein LEP1GSC050_2971 [Leptospira broomii serovar Hurstbridge str. 5399]
MLQQLIYRGVKGVTSLGNEYRILEKVLPKHMLGKTLSECRIREDWNLNLVTVKRPKKIVRIKAPRKFSEFSSRI